MEISSDYVFIAIALAAAAAVGSFIIGFFLGRKTGVDAEESPRPVYRRKEITETRLEEMHRKVESLDELNSRYLNFMLKVPAVVNRLNATMKFEEITEALLRIVKEIISTDRVELYVLDREAGALRKVAKAGGIEEATWPLGKGLVGRAAEDMVIRLRGQGDMAAEDRDGPLWMAAPIQFNKRLLGVIGIGDVVNATGDERTLLVMVADIAAVALVNQASLGVAKREAITDPLTGLHNRRYFFERSIDLVEKAIAMKKPITIFLFDIDNFKHYNDTNGHAEGDRLLKELSGLIREVTRKSNVIARYGGEEFIVMLPDIAKEDCFIYADRLRKKISEHPFANREKQPLGCVSISGGIASYPDDGGSVQEVIKLADAALYQAKSGGRNRVELHQPFMFSDLTKEEDDIISPPC